MQWFKAELHRYRTWPRAKQIVFWVAFFFCCGSPCIFLLADPRPSRLAGFVDMLLQQHARSDCSLRSREHNEPMRAADYAFFDVPFTAFAHRGGATYEPNRHRENSLHAFKEAVARLPLPQDRRARHP